MKQKYIVCKQLQNEVEGKQQFLDQQLSRLNVISEEDAHRLEAFRALYPQISEQEQSQLIDSNNEKMDNLKMALKSSITIQNDSRRGQKPTEKDIQILTNEIDRLNRAVVAKARQQNHRTKKAISQRDIKKEVFSKSVVNIEANQIVPRKRHKRNNTAAREAGEIATSTPCPNAPVETHKKKKNKIKHTPTTADSLALNCSSTILATDLRNSRAQKAELVKKREHMEETILAEQADSLRLEKELEQCHTLSDQLEVILNSDSNKNAKIIVEIQKSITAFQESTQSLQGKLARACVTAEDSSLPSSNEEGADLEILLPPLPAYATRNDVPTDSKT